jgi:hypothetical protein
VTDDFNGRALTYNEQAAATKRQVILSNVVRSAYTLPLQFTDISTMTGQSGAQASLSATSPFVVRGAIPTLQGSFTPNGNVSGSLTFAVTNLNTQEFYNGIQSPIDKQLVAFYLKSGFPARVLLPLVISDIEITQNGKRFRIENDPTRPEAFFTFNTAIQSIINYGLDTRESSATKPAGPVISYSQAAHPQVQAALLSAPDGAPSLAQVAGGYQLQRRSSSLSFCFNPATTLRSGVTVTSNNEKAPPLRIPLIFRPEGPLPETIIGPVSPALLCNANSSGKKEGYGSVDVNFTMRSLEGIFSYLGAISRTELGLAGAAPNPLQLKAFDGSDYRIFRLQKGPGIGNALSVSIGQSSYHVDVDPTGRDSSSRVLQLVTDLWALKSSAKNLPSPTVISVLSQ